MKRLLFLALMVSASLVTACGHRRTSTDIRHYPTISWETLKIVSLLNTIDQHFDAGVHEHIVLRPEEDPTLVNYHRKKDTSFYIKKPFRPRRVRRYYTWDHVHNVMVYGPNIDEQISVSGFGDTVSINTGVPLKYSPFGYANVSNTLGLPYSIKPGASLYIDNSFYPKTIGFGDGAARTAPISLAYFPEGEFSGLIPGYTVTQGGLNHVLRLKTNSGGALVPLNNLKERLKIYGGLDHVKGVDGVLSGFIEHDKLRYGTFTITNLFANESELTYEVYLTPQPI